MPASRGSFEKRSLSVPLPDGFDSYFITNPEQPADIFRQLYGIVDENQILPEYIIRFDYSPDDEGKKTVSPFHC